MTRQPAFVTLKELLVKQHRKQKHGNTPLLQSLLLGRLLVLISDVSQCRNDLYMVMS